MDLRGIPGAFQFRALWYLSTKHSRKMPKLTEDIRSYLVCIMHPHFETSLLAGVYSWGDECHPFTYTLAYKPANPSANIPTNLSSNAHGANPHTDKFTHIYAHNHAT